MSAGPYVLGIDASLTRTAAVLVPVDWEYDWSRVVSMVAGSRLTRGASQDEQAERCERIGETLARLARNHAIEGSFIENYSFGSHFGAHQLGELRGVLRNFLFRALGTSPKPVAITSHRKLLFGSVPKLRGDALKHHIVTTLRGWGAPHAWGDDVCDAFSVANYGLSELGYPALTLASAAQAVGA